MAAGEDKVPFVKSHASVMLDAVRGVAAVLVTLEHLRLRLFFEFTPAELHHNPALHALFILASFGHSSVIVFFVLSGFLVGGSLLRAYENKTWSWRSYLTHRFVRLWIVLVPALLIGMVWDTLSIHVAHGRLNPPVVDARVAQTAAYLTVSGFLGNVAFLQTTLVPVFGSNGALWSLNNEFWYYILFPLGFFALFPRYRLAVRLPFAVAFVLLLTVLGQSLAILAPLWLFGALLFYLPRSNFSESTRYIALALYVVTVPVLVDVSFRFPTLADYGIAVATCIFLWIVLSARAAANPTSLPTRGFRLLARFSYTLYLIHVPIFTFAGVCLVRSQSWQPTLPHLACAFVIWLATILFALCIASVTEFRTDEVRRWVETRTWRRGPASEPAAG